MVHYWRTKSLAYVEKITSKCTHVSIDIVTVSNSIVLADYIGKC